jgi:hypothetical protein
MEKSVREGGRRGRFVREGGPGNPVFRLSWPRILFISTVLEMSW